ncbi:Detected protein of confused Function [Hibiscus syriacus]|uniref:Detected protein of confused Function n=1 Tax=Hibiscus syriacus TaxID=106335 RepID=A0A6A3CCT5_HIBSY|nr:Detected protein of confused Function [Hibiscus syriacus]
MFLRRKHTPKDDSEQRDAKVSELRTTIGPLSGRSSMYCTDACLRRYLEARNWNVYKAKKMLEETLKWRSTYKPDEIRWWDNCSLLLPDHRSHVSFLVLHTTHEVALEGETGKVSRANFHDRQGRTVLIMRPGMQNTTSAENNIRHLVYLLENAILNLSEGQDQMSWLIDFTGFSLSTSVPIRTARDIIYILQSHYPERLAIAFLYNPPRFFEAFYKAVKLFLDPKTAQKVKFVYPKNNDSVELMRSYFDVENLPGEFGGKATLKYDHEEFSRLMAQDDVKTAKFWGTDEKHHQIGNAHSGTRT